MTAAGRPTFHPPQRSDPEWVAHAICTPDPAWTLDTKPERQAMRALESQCARCPVSADCAAMALDEGLSGVYAGVYLPGSAGPERAAARQLLRGKLS